MPAGSTAAPAFLSFADVGACTDVPSIINLFRKLRYPVEPTPTPVALDEGDLPGSLRDAVAARYPIAQIGGARPGEPAPPVWNLVAKVFEHIGGQPNVPYVGTGTVAEDVLSQGHSVSGTVRTTTAHRRVLRHGPGSG